MPRFKRKPNERKSAALCPAGPFSLKQVSNSEAAPLAMPVGTLGGAGPLTRLLETTGPRQPPQGQPGERPRSPGGSPAASSARRGSLS